LEKEKDMRKKENLKVMAGKMKELNEQNKQMKLDAKQKQREIDIKMSKDYVELVNKQEQKKRDEIQKRADRIN
jgi:vacuolar-type H+-ATPase subunit H